MPQVRYLHKIFISPRVLRAHTILGKVLAFRNAHSNLSAEKENLLCEDNRDLGSLSRNFLDEAPNRAQERTVSSWIRKNFLEEREDQSSKMKRFS